MSNEDKLKKVWFQGVEDVSTLFLDDPVTKLSGGEQQWHISKIFQLERFFESKFHTLDPICQSYVHHHSLMVHIQEDSNTLCWETHQL